MNVNVNLNLNLNLNRGGRVEAFSVRSHSTFCAGKKTKQPANVFVHTLRPPWLPRPFPSRVRTLSALDVPSRQSALVFYIVVVSIGAKREYQLSALRRCHTSRLRWGGCLAL